METIELSLPADVTDWIEAQVQAGRYSTASAYVCELVQRDQARKAKVAEMQALVTEGINSGVSTRTKEDIKRLSKDVADRTPRLLVSLFVEKYQGLV